MKSRILRSPATRLKDNGVNLTHRGEVAANVGTAIVAGGLAVAAVLSVRAIERASAQTDRPSHKQVQQSEQLIKSADRLTGSFKLESGVNVRLSPTVQNGDIKTGRADNIVEGLIPDGKRLNVSSAIPLDNGWVAFERPETDSKTLEDRAEDLVYVDVADIKSSTNTADMVTDPGLIDHPVEFVETSAGSGFVYSDSDQQPTGALSSIIQ